MKKYLLLIATMVMLLFTMSITANAATVEGSTNTGWSYDENTSTLTLTNYTSTEAISVGSETCQIYSDGDLNIVLEGTNNLNLTSTYGIYVEGNLTISGTGTLNISNATNGIFASKNITIKSGIISASSIQARGGVITIDDGKVNLTGNITASDGQVTINKGEIKSSTVTAKNILINNGFVDSKLSATLKIEVNDGELYSTSIRISNNDGVFSVTGGKVTINGEVNLSCDASFSGGEIDITDNGGIYVYLGLYVKGGNINIIGGIDGTLDMTGGTLYVDGNIGDVMDSNISGGTLTVKGEIYSGWSTIRISGGTVTIESDGYGLRTADEDIIISGGTVSIFGQTQALKAGGEIRWSGNCISFLTGPNASNAKVETQYYGEKYVGTKESHSWNSGNVTTNPTHVTEGTRTYTCNNCGNKKYEAIPKTTAHEFGGWTYVDNVSHKRVCSCGEIETESHTWSDATCTQKSKCSACTSERGEVDVDNHTAATSWTCANDQHYHVCTNGCDAKLDVANCTDSDKDHKCDVCSADMGPHEAANGKHTCDYCGKTVSECTDSTEDDDSKCDICGKNVGDCVDANKDHKCDKHDEEMGVHEAALGKHTCDYCGAVISECIDSNADGKCDICYKDLGTVHTHTFVEGKCACGETDPNYVPPHEHTFVEGKCECGETDPNHKPETDDPEEPPEYKPTVIDLIDALLGSPVLLVALIAGVGVLAFSIGCIVVEYRKRR